MGKKDLALSVPIRFALSFGLVSKENPISPNRTFYWGGLGGSHVTMDLDVKLCWAFAMNKMIMSLTGDPITLKIRETMLKTY